ncbi:SpoIVB peptidase S55 domain-containing protein [Acidobacteriota bacterium]
MRKPAMMTVIVVISALVFVSVLEAQEMILPVDEIKAGMKGKGRSVFLGDKIEEFDVEILGVMRNVRPKKDMIVVRVKGEAAERAGVIQGMSGSPIYVNGKLIGALSYMLARFSKEPIAGVTPIGEMLSLPKRESSKATFSARIPVVKHMTLSDLFEVYSTHYFRDSSLVAEGKTFSPIGIPLVFSGFTSDILKKAEPFFSKLGFSPMNAIFSGQTEEKISLPDLNLEGGDSVGAQIVTGDLNMSSVGTVTYVDGNKVYAFGHPMYNLGAVEYTMTKAEVMGIMPSLEVSFKLTSKEVPIGRFTQDRTPGVYGEIGQLPRMIPLNIVLQNDSGEKEEYRVKLTEDKIFTPLLANMVVSTLITGEERSISDLSLELKGDIYLENGKSVHLEDLFSGNFDSSVSSLSSLVTSVVYFLTSNEFRDLAIHRIDLNINSSEELKYSFLEKVWLDKYDVSPGEIIRIKVFTRNFRGEVSEIEGGIPVPQLPSGSEFYLIVADAGSLQRIEANQYKSQAFIPRNLEQLLRILSSFRKNNRIYFKILASKPGLFLKGEEMPNLPLTMKSMFSSPRAASSSPTELDKSTLGYLQQPVSSVFRGVTLIPLKIK